MCRALGDDFSPLSCHQIQQLVDEEGGWQGRNTPTGDSDELSADGTPEMEAGNEVVIKRNRNVSFLVSANNKHNCIMETMNKSYNIFIV